jgi:hypothetical protein
MPLSQAARIWRMKREAERDLAARRAEQNKNRGPQQALARDGGRDRLDPTPAGLPEVAAPAPQAPRADRVRDAADGPDPGAVGRQHGPEPDQPVRGDQEPDSDLDSSASDDRTSARDRLRAAGLDRPATRSIAERTGHGTDQRLEHPPGTKDRVEGHHVIAAVTAAAAPPKTEDRQFRPQAGSDQQQRNGAQWASSGEPTRPVAKGDRGRRDTPPGRGGVDPRSVPNPKAGAEAAVERLKEILHQRAAHRTEEEQAEIDQARRAVREPDPDEIDPGVAADLEAAGESLDQRAEQRRRADGEQADAGRSESESRGPIAGRDRETGRFLERHKKVGGRVAGTPNALPPGAYKAMKELIAGRLQKDHRPVSEVMVELIFEGLEGNVALAETIGEKGSVILHYANPAVFLKMLLDYMLKSRELAFKIRDAEKKNQGTGGGIRIVLPSAPSDPLLRPGQQPRGLRILGQNPDKPLRDVPGTSTDEQPSPGSVPPHSDGAQQPANTRSTSSAITSPDQRLNQQPSAAPAPTPKAAFDPSELIEDFEHPICQLCMGGGWVRDENGINMVRCDYCEGKGRAPAPE